MSQAPPKPWEVNAPGAASASSLDVPAASSSALTKHPDNPHIARAPGPTTASAQSSAQAGSVADASSANASSASLAPAVPAYGASSYGSMYSPYGAAGGMSSMYGGAGMYGAGGMYGGYGGGMYGAGMMQPYGGLGPMSYMQSSVDSVGRFSSMLQMASQALHMTFSSLVQFASGVASIVREFGGLFSLAYLWRLFRVLFRKLRNFLYWMLRRPIPRDDEFEALFNSSSAAGQAAGAAQGPTPPTASPNWISLGFYTFGSLWLLQWIWNAIKRDNQAQNQAQMMQPPGYGGGYGMQPMGYGGAYGGMQPGYGYGAYGGGGYGQPAVMAPAATAVSAESAPSTTQPATESTS